MSSLGLSETAGHRGVHLGFDRISCDIESLTPAHLRKIIGNLKPKLYDYDMKLYHHTVHGSKTFHQILKELHLLQKVTDFPTIEVHC